MSSLDPLWMPKGSVRAIAFLGLLYSALWMAADGGEVPGEIWGLLGVAWTLYFKSREGDV